MGNKDLSDLRYRYIHHLETHADPQLTLQENWELRQAVAQLEAMVRRLKAG